MHERGGDRRVNSTREPANHSRLADHLPNAGDLLFDERARRPRRLRLADREQEVRDDLSAARCVRDFGVELHSEGRSRLVPECADRVAVALRGYQISLWRLLDMVAVTHPGGDRLLCREAGKQPFWLHDLPLGWRVLATIRANHLSAFDVRYQLHSVADAEHGGDVEDGRIGERDVVAIDRVWSAAQNDPGGLPVANPLHARAGRMNFGVHTRLANSPGNQLREL